MNDKASETEEKTNVPDIKNDGDVPTAANKTSAGGRGGIGSALKGMVSFFTMIRLNVGETEFDAMERNFWLVPLIGALNGLVTVVVCLILSLCGASVVVQAVCALATAFLFSKFLHLDGLTDFGDGMIVSSGKREDHIRALKDSLIGAGGFGVALIVILISFACYAEVGGLVQVSIDGMDYRYFGLVPVVFSLEVLIKNAQVAAAAFGEPGNGMAARQVSCTGRSSLIKSTLLTAVLVLISSLVGVAISNGAEYSYMEFDALAFVIYYVLALLISIVVGWAMARTANKTFGFVNGDILGATNEISRAVILLSFVIILGVF